MMLTHMRKLAAGLRASPLFPGLMLLLIADLAVMALYAIYR